MFLISNPIDNAAKTGPKYATKPPDVAAFYAVETTRGLAI